MKLSLVERETILLYNQAEPMAEIYTHDPRLMEKLDLLAKKHPDQITRKDAHNFTVPKRCVSVREPYSAERRSDFAIGNTCLALPSISSTFMSL